MDIFFDEDHDATLLNGDLRFTADGEDVKQRLTIHLQFLLAEWFINTAVGIPYTQIIFDLAQNNIELVYTMMRSEIKNVEGVTTIDELTIVLDGDSGELSVALVVNKTVGVEVVI